MSNIPYWSSVACAIAVAVAKNNYTILVPLTMGILPRIVDTLKEIWPDFIKDADNGYVAKPFKRSLSPLRSGNYCANGVWYNRFNCLYNQKLIVEGPTAIIKDSFGNSYDTKIEIGNFGKADAEIVEATGQDFYNMKLTIFNFQMDSIPPIVEDLFDNGVKKGENLEQLLDNYNCEELESLKEAIENFGKEKEHPRENGTVYDSTEYGVVKHDGAIITMKGIAGIFVLEWKTQEEADAFDADGDPVEAPPCSHKIQPDNPGKFLWITGPSGTGKSSSAQLLSKVAGYVYYEGDCFRSCKNPYIPSDAPDPSMAQHYQRNLTGEGLETRKKAIQKAVESFKQVMVGEDFVIEDYEEYYRMMCEDIKKERKRIGGDWVVASLTIKREIRDFIKSCLGPELVFVVLGMEEEELKKRNSRRNHGDASLLNRWMTASRISDPVGDDEENALKVMATDDMTKEKVVYNILQMV